MHPSSSWPTRRSSSYSPFPCSPLGSCFSAGSAAATPKPPTKSTSSLARAPGPTFKPMRPVHSTPTFNSSLPQPSIKTHVVQASSLKAERARAAAEDEEDELMAPPPPAIKKAAVVVKKESAPVDLPAAALAAASPVKKKQALYVSTPTPSFPFGSVDERPLC
jgi:hypothetical protein